MHSYLELLRCYCSCYRPQPRTRCRETMPIDFVGDWCSDDEAAQAEESR
jgi:hypothetical protein